MKTQVIKKLKVVALLMSMLTLTGCFEAMFSGDEDSGGGSGKGVAGNCGFDFDGFYEDGGETGEFNFNSNCDDEFEDFVDEKFDGRHCHTTDQAQSELEGEFFVISTDDGIRSHIVTFDGAGNGEVASENVELHYNVCENRGIQLFAKSPDGHNDILLGALAHGGGFIFATSAKNYHDFDQGPNFVIGIKTQSSNDPATSGPYHVSFITGSESGYAKLTFNNQSGTDDKGSYKGGITGEIQGDNTCTGTWRDSEDSDTPLAIDVDFNCTGDGPKDASMVGFISSDQQKLLLISESANENYDDYNSGDDYNYNDDYNYDTNSDNEKGGAIAFGTLSESIDTAAIQDYYFGFSINFDESNQEANIDSMFIDFTDGETFKYNALSCDNGDCYGEGTFEAGGSGDGTFSATAPGENGEDDTHSGYVNASGDLIHIPGSLTDHSLTVLVKVGEKGEDDAEFQEQLDVQDDLDNQP